MHIHIYKCGGASSNDANANQMLKDFGMLCHQLDPCTSTDPHIHKFRNGTAMQMFAYISLEAKGQIYFFVTPSFTVYETKSPVYYFHS